MRTYSKKKVLLFAAVIIAILVVLFGRTVYLIVFRSEHYTRLADELHQRERSIKAARGRILDRNGIVLADNKCVCTVSVIYNQVTEPENVISVLSHELGIDENGVRKKVEKVSSRERIASNVDKETGDRIRQYGLAGVKVDEDYKRYYLYDELASKVIGFTGGDNQGVVGLEAKYENVLAGKDGMILTVTDAKGSELDGIAEGRIEPVAGDDLVISIDYNIQMYATQLAMKTLEAKKAKSVSIIVMEPCSGEIYALASVPEYNLNNPFELNVPLEGTVSKQDALNRMWRNSCICDTYEPGSIFKTVTASIGLECKAVSLSDTYSCPGYKIVEDRRIRCARTTGHGFQTFKETVENSCNPAFIEWGLRIGSERFYDYFESFGFFEKTGIDISGEAGTIMHKKDAIGSVELATISFGQSFQITPVKMLQTVSMIINGGNLVTPHFAIKSVTTDNGENTMTFPVKEHVISKETSETMRDIMEAVVSEGGGSNAYIEGYDIGGKTATSEKLPRSANKYIASFVGFAPADNPKVIAMCIIDEPAGTYYGGMIAAPVIKELYENILPYLGIAKRTIE